jgi:uncharacterized protein
VENSADPIEPKLLRLTEIKLALDRPESFCLPKQTNQQETCLPKQTNQQETCLPRQTNQQETSSASPPELKSNLPSGSVEPYMAQLRELVCERLGIPDAQLLSVAVFRRGFDARKRSAIQLIYTLLVSVRDIHAVLAKNIPHVSLALDTDYHAPTSLAEQATRQTSLAEQATRQTSAGSMDTVQRPVIIGFGPCGLFAALVLAQWGLRPLVLERGKEVRARTKDTWGLWRKQQLNPESNVQFGEGGAGTFSDGKLWSQVSDPRHLGRKVLHEFVKAGAPEDIMWVSKPHIGTFRLVSVIEKMRAEIIALGGEVRFEAKVTDLLVEANAVRGVCLSDGSEIRSDHVVLAIGHSARDTFAMLHARGVYIEPKAFSIGFRIEHPQHVIDQARYGSFAGHDVLGAADYKFVHHAQNGRSVYSFCMCPGGTVVAATSETGRVVTNGMSQYSRNERNANAGLVVGITPKDFTPAAGAAPAALAGLEFQRQLEAGAFALGGSNYFAPAQRVEDFLKNRASTGLGAVVPSYKPGITLTNLAAALPDYAITAMREAIPALERQIRGFSMPDAMLTGVETRTSSPIRITRGADYQSVNVRGLYPAGEGASYAGGIMSAAIDGIEVAEALFAAMQRGKASAMANAQGFATP